MAPFDIHVLDVGAEGFGDPQTVHRQQCDQRVIPGRAQAGLDEQGAEFVAVEPLGAGLVVDFGAADAGGRVAVGESFDVAVPVEAGQRRQPSGHRRAHLAVGLHGPGEQLEMCSLDIHET